MESKVEERTKELVKERDYTRHLIESSPDFQMTLDRNGKIKDVLREIRGNYPYLPVILITGYAGEMGSLVEEGLELSAFAYLYKPLEMEKLFAKNRQLFVKRAIFFLL